MGVRPFFLKILQGHPQVLVKPPLMCPSQGVNHTKKKPPHPGDERQGEAATTTRNRKEARSRGDYNGADPHGMQPFCLCLSQGHIISLFSLHLLLVTSVSTVIGTNHFSWSSISSTTFLGTIPLSFFGTCKTISS